MGSNSMVDKRFIDMNLHQSQHLDPNFIPNELPFLKLVLHLTL